MGTAINSQKLSEISRVLEGLIKDWIDNIRTVQQRDDLKPLFIETQNAQINGFMNTPMGREFHNCMPQEAIDLVHIKQMMAEARERAEKEMKKLNIEAAKIETAVRANAKRLDEGKRKQAWAEAREQMQEIQLGLQTFIMNELAKIIEALELLRKKVQISPYRAAAA